MFCITKHICGKPRRYLYEAYRDKKTGKPKKRLVTYLGDFQTAKERLAYINTELAHAKRKESKLRQILELDLSSLRSADRCPSWQEIDRMTAAHRRIFFTQPGTFDASKKIGPLRRRITKLAAKSKRLSAILPRVVIAAK